MATGPNNNLGNKVVTRSTSWLDYCESAWGSEFRAPDHGIYQFSNGRQWDSTDKYLTGIYGVVPGIVMLLDGTQYPDMRDGLFFDETLPGGSMNNGFGSYKEATEDV